MTWRRVDLNCLFFLLIPIATFTCVAYAQSDINEPSNRSLAECIGRRCTRYWSTSMWGFIATLVALTMDVWGYAKSWDESTIARVLMTFFLSALNPLFIIGEMLQQTINGMAMLPNLREILGDDVVAPRYPWSKSHIKIISGCRIVVNLSPDIHKETSNLNTFKDKVEVKDLSEALVIGTKVENSNQLNVELSKRGKLALLRSNVLPPYDEVKFLRGNSTLGMVVASTQAIGYIYGIGVRCVQGLQVSPIEAIACVLNMVILMKSLLHNFASLGHRPLLLYLLPEEEAKFIEECKTIQNFDFKGGGGFKLGVLIACGFLLAVGAYFIDNFYKSMRKICIVPIVLFEMSLLSGGILVFGGWRDGSGNLDFYKNYIAYEIMLSNLLGYVWALAVTFKYWRAEDFDVQSSNYLSQILPYIG